MKSRLALLHLAVVPMLLWAAETWTPSVELYWVIRFVYGTLVQRKEGRRRRPGERWLDWQLRTFIGDIPRAAAVGFPGADKNGELSERLQLRRYRHPRLEFGLR